MEYKLNQGLVIRLEVNNEQRIGVVRKLFEDGSAEVEIARGTRIRFYKNGSSFMGSFTVIKLGEVWGTQLASRLLTEQDTTLPISKRASEIAGFLAKVRQSTSSQ